MSTSVQIPAPARGGHDGGPPAGVPSLNHALAGWTGFPVIERQFAPRLTPRAAAAAAKRLGEASEPRPPLPYDLEALHGRVRRAWLQHRSLDGIAARDLRRLPWVLFYPSDARGNAAADWLGADAALVQAYRRWLLDSRSGRPALALLHEFLRVHPTALPTLRDVRQSVRYAIDPKAEDERQREKSASAPPSLQMWRRRCRQYGLLVEDGDLAFVLGLIGNDTAPHVTLQDAGFNAGLTHAGFLESGLRRCLPHVLGQLSQNTLDLAALDRLCTFIEFDGGLRFETRSVRVELAGALLHPFVDRAPAGGIRKRLQEFFLRLYGDPRLPHSKHHWSGIADDQRRVVIRWLAKGDLDLFVRLIRETALDRHWLYREAFWNAFLHRDLIDDTWVLLGKQAAKLAAKLAPHVPTGKLRGAAGDQSVLLLGMPGVTIAEWSHNGACRIWLDGTPGAPQLYDQDYTRTALTGQPDFLQRHIGSDRGRWQLEVARWLRDNTGVQIARHEYMSPRTTR